MAHANSSLQVLLPHPRAWLVGRAEYWRSTALETWLKRAVRESDVGDEYDARAHALGLDTPPPIAATCALGFDLNESANENWLRIDPVVLHADLSRVRLLGWGHTLPEHSVSQKAISVVRDFLVELGGDFFPVTESKWLVRFSKSPQIETQRPGPYLGADVSDALPGGPDGALWRRYLTELQMLLHASGTDRQPHINSVWPWGGGQLSEPDVDQSPRTSILSDSTYTIGLTKLLGGQAAPLGGQLPVVPNLVIDAMDVRIESQLAEIFDRAAEWIDTQKPRHILLAAPGFGRWSVGSSKWSWSRLGRRGGIDRWIAGIENDLR